MPRIRSIKPQFFLNDELASLHPLDRLLFIGLWTMADRDGRLEERPLKIKAALLPYDAYDIEEALKRLSGKKFIVRYGVRAEKSAEKANYIEISNFRKHQCPNVKEPESTIPAPCRHHKSTPRLGKGKEGKGEGGGALGRGECAPSSSGKTASPEILNDTSSTASGDENATRAHSPLQAAGSSGRIEIVSLHLEDSPQQAAGNLPKNQGKVLPDDLKIKPESGRPEFNGGFQREGAPAAGGRYADLSGKAEFKPARNAKQLAVRGTGGQLLSRQFQQGRGLSPDNRRARHCVKEAGEAGRLFNPHAPRAAPVAPKAPCANDANGLGKKGKHDDIAEKI